MDPNTVYATLARLATTLQYATPTERAGSDIAEMHVELAEQWEALDGWLRSGGFLPAAWVRP